MDRVLPVSKRPQPYVAQFNMATSDARKILLRVPLRAVKWGMGLREGGKR